MSSRVKFLMLVFLSFSGFTTVFLLFLHSDYARRERAWFRDYPYREMAVRKARHPAQPEISAPAEDTRLAEIPDIISLPDIISPDTARLKPVNIHKRLKKAVTQSRPAPRRKAVETPEKPDMPVKTIAPTPPVSWRHAAARGYKAYREGDYPVAIRYLEQALKSAPDSRALYEQLAYAYKKTGQTSRAASSFKQAIDSYHEGAVPLRLRREVAQLERRFQADGYAIYRAESSTIQQLGADLTRSQTGLEVSYQLENPARIQIYGRLLAGTRQDSLRLDRNSYQAGIGLRLKPLANHNLLLSVERLVRVGRFARNDWMIRAGYSLDHGTGYRQDKAGWWRYNLYLDAALINPADPDIFLTAQTIGGYSMSLSPGLVIEPRLTTLATWQQDRFRKASLIESGPGINLRYYFNDSKYHAYRASIELTAEYRLKLSGSSIGGSGPVVSLIAHF